MASCLQCKFLFTRDTGYSNYTVEDTDAHCLLRRNPHLPKEVPDEIRVWTHINPVKKHDLERNQHAYLWVAPEQDKWFATKDSRCDKYEGWGVPYHIDCDGDEIMSIKQAEDHFFRTGDGMPLRIARYFGADYDDNIPDWKKP